MELIDIDQSLYKINLMLPVRELNTLIGLSPGLQPIMEELTMIWPTMIRVLTSLVLVSLIPTSFCYAEEPVPFKDWIVASGAGFMYAATINKVDNVFGMYCTYNDGNCYYKIIVNSSCDKGDKSPVLVNTDTSDAYAAEIDCDGKVSDSNGYRYFLNGDETDDVIKKDNAIGFAIPIENNEFLAVRFSLSGSTEAIRYLLKHFITEKAQDNKPF